MLYQLSLSFFFSLSASSRPIKIVGIPEEPFRFYDDKNNLTGIDIDITSRIFKRLKIPYKIALLSSSQSLTKFYEENLCDMFLTLSKTKERSKNLTYPKESHIEIPWHFFILNNNKKKFDFSNWQGLRNLRVGITKDFAYTPEFWQEANKSYFKPVYEIYNEKQLVNIMEEKIDTAILNRMTSQYRILKYIDLKVKNAKKVIPHGDPIKITNYFNPLVKSSTHPKIDLIKKNYDDILKNMKKSGEIKNIINKYIPNS